MTNINDISITAEERMLPAEQIVQQKEPCLQTILDKFQQPIPDNFLTITLGAGSYCGSTNVDWKDKPHCERYGFDYQGEWIEIDVPHSILEKWGLAKGQNLAEILYLDPKVLTRKAIKGGKTVEESELILKKPLTINNLEAALTRWEQEIRELKVLVQQLTSEQNDKQQFIAELQAELATAVVKVQQLEIELSNLTNASQTEIFKLKAWIKQAKLELVPLFCEQALYTEDTPVVEVFTANLKTLIQEAKRGLQERDEDRAELANVKKELAQQTVQLSNYLNELENLREEVAKLKKQDRKSVQCINQRKKDIECLTAENNNLVRCLTEHQTENANSQNSKEQELNNLRVQLEQKDQQIATLKQERDKRPDLTFKQWNNTQQKLEALEKELDNVKSRINPTWQKFQLHCATSFFYPSARLRENKQSLYPNIKDNEVFHNFSMAVLNDHYQNQLPALDLTKTWGQLFPVDFSFADRYVMPEGAWQDFGRMFEEWRLAQLSFEWQGKTYIDKSELVKEQQAWNKLAGLWKPDGTANLVIINNSDPLYKYVADRIPVEWRMSSPQYKFELLFDFNRQQIWAGHDIRHRASVILQLFHDYYKEH